MGKQLPRLPPPNGPIEKNPKDILKKRKRLKILYRVMANKKREIKGMKLLIFLVLESFVEFTNTRYSVAPYVDHWESYAIRSLPRISLLNGKHTRWLFGPDSVFFNAVRKTTFF